MLYYTKVLKCANTPVSEYDSTETNSITTSNDNEQVDMGESIITCTENLVEFNAPYKNKEVTIHLEFPEEQDEAAATDFMNRLKGIYLEKIKSQSMQMEIPALQSETTREKEEDANG